jgi:hypothetical protein
MKTLFMIMPFVLLGALAGNTPFGTPDSSLLTNSYKFYQGSFTYNFKWNVTNDDVGIKTLFGMMELESVTATPFATSWMGL